MTNWLHTLRRWERRRVTLRSRITILSTGLLFAFLLGIILPINVTLVPELTAACLSFGWSMLFDFTLASLGGLALATAFSVIVGYWLAGRLLQPLLEFSKAVKQIDPSNLGTRLALESPEDELKQVADAFDQTLDRLQATFEQQDRFAGNAAHSLRTPLATMRANLEVLHSDPDASLEDYREMSTILERNLSRLERAVANLLLLSRGEKDAAKEEVMLRPLLEDLVLLLKPMAEERAVNVHLTCETGVSVRGDEPLLARVFGNLVENAILYNQPNGYVTLKLRSDSAWAVITVTDTGIGIAPEEQAHVFEPFYRGERSSTLNREGAGLGLALVAHMVRLHGGAVEIKSTLGVGTSVIVRLPLFPISPVFVPALNGAFMQPAVT